MSRPPSDPTASLAEHGRFLRAVARRLVGNDADADDLVQETFVRAITRPARHGNLRAWLVAIVRNVFRDQHAAEAARRRRERAAAESSATAHADGDDPLGIEALQAAMRALPDGYRRVLEQRYYAQRSPAEIAARLGVPQATVKTRLNRALALLRRDLEQRTGGRQRLRDKLAGLCSASLLPDTSTIAAVGSFTGAMMMKKIAIAGASLAALLLSLSLATAPDPSQPPVGHVDAGPSASQGEVVRAGTGARTTSTDIERTAVDEADDARRVEAPPLRGRVVYASTGQGVPFAIVRVREGNRSEQIDADRDGCFVAARHWSTACELSFEGEVVGVPAPTTEPAAPAPPARPEPPRLEPARPAMSAGAVPRTIQTRSLIGLDRISLLDAAATATWLARTAFAEGAFEVRLQLGPTYFVAGLESSGPFRAALSNGADADLGSLRRDSPEQTSLVHAVPGLPGRWWLRAAIRRNPWPLTSPHLHVFDGAGLHRGDGPVRVVDGVQDEVVPLTWRSCGAVHGVLRDEGDAPVADVAVHFRQLPRNAPNRYHTGCRTDAAGRFALAFLPPGDGLLALGDERTADLRETITVVAGEDHEHDLRVRTRPIAGALRGTVTTSSGRRFAMATVILTCHDDTSIWRNGGIDWQEQGGRTVGVFEFVDVPLVECDVTLQTFQPCGVPVAVQRVTAPLDGIAFTIDDTCAMATVRFEPVDGSGRPVHDVEVLARGPGGWVVHSEVAEGGGAELALPVGQSIAFRVLGGDVRAAEGTLLVQAAGGTVRVPTVPGFSAELSTLSMRNFAGVPGLELLADDRSVGLTDRAGELVIDLPNRPRTLRIDEAQWRVVDNRTYDSDIAVDGTFAFDEHRGRLFLYLAPVD